MPEFKKFRRKSMRSPKQPLITIQRRGTLSLNQAAYQLLGEPNFVELLYDEDEQIIGLRATNDKDPDAYPVHKQKESLTYLIAGMAFLNYLGIPFNEARRYVPKMIDDVVAIDLKSASKSVNGPRTSEQEPSEISA